MGQEDPLEEESTIHSKILGWEIPWTGYSPQGLKKIRQDLMTEQQQLLMKENQKSQVKEFSSFLCVGRCKRMGSPEAFL